MKRIGYMLLALLFFACYDDKGNYDYRTLEEVEISLPQEAYSLNFGDVLQIVPTIETSIPEEDLNYNWEVLGDALGNWWDEYFSVFEGRNLDYVCVQDSLLFTVEGTYSFRLNITQVSTGRHFYSDDVAVTLVGEPSVYGAMVLHGDGVSSDIGLIEAGEFQLVAPSSLMEAQVYPHYYSEANGGVKIDGAGWKVVQTYSEDGIAMYPENVVVIALTDESSAIARSKTLEKTGEWNDLFVGNLNAGQPQAVQLIGMFNDLYVMDGGEIFAKQYMSATFRTPLIVVRDYGYDFFPGIWNSATGATYAVLFFDRNSRGFIGVMNINYSWFSGFVPLDATEEGPVAGVPFNPADMQADLVYMEEGGSLNHFVAVMREDDGDYFLAELDPMAASNAEVPLYRYDLSHVSEVQNEDVVAWAFGSSYINMGYYATSTSVRQFTVESGNAIAPEPLRMQSNEEVVFEGEITMMKILKTGVGEDYYMSNRMMVVGTYGGTSGSGKLYSIELDQFSGRAVSVKVYEGFDRIYDVNIKGY